MSKQLGEQFVATAMRGDFKDLAALFSENVVFIAATPGCSSHLQGLVRTGQALRELFPPSEK